MRYSITREHMQNSEKALEMSKREYFLYIPYFHGNDNVKSFILLPNNNKYVNIATSPSGSSIRRMINFFCDKASNLVKERDVCENLMKLIFFYSPNSKEYKKKTSIYPLLIEPFYRKNIFSFDYFMEKKKDGDLFFNNNVFSCKENNIYMFHFLLNMLLFLRESQLANDDEIHKYLESTKVCIYKVENTEEGDSRKISYYDEVNINFFLDKLENFYRKYNIKPDFVCYDEDLVLREFFTVYLGNPTEKDRSIEKNLENYLYHCPFYLYNLSRFHREYRESDKKYNKLFLYTFPCYMEERLKKEILNEVSRTFSHISKKKTIKRIFPFKEYSYPNVHQCSAIFYDVENREEYENFIGLFDLCCNATKSVMNNTVRNMSMKKFSFMNQLWYLFLDTEILDDYLGIFYDFSHSR